MTPTSYHIDVLAFAPHPDDAEIGCGGLLATMSDLGYRTGVVDLTRGELSTGGDIKTRSQEIDSASEALGLSLRENAQLPDGGINAYDSCAKARPKKDSQVGEIVSLLRRLRPELVLAPHDHGRHPDHIAASELISRAVFFANLKNFKDASGLNKLSIRQVLYYQIRYQFRPSFIMDISGASERKMKAIACYGSQLIQASANPLSQPLIASPLSTSAIEARDRYHGAMIGVSHGEAYLSRNVLGMSDPLKFFQTNPNTNSIFFPEKL